MHFVVFGLTLLIHIESSTVYIDWCKEFHFANNDSFGRPTFVPFPFSFASSLSPVFRRLLEFRTESHSCRAVNRGGMFASRLYYIQTVLRARQITHVMCVYICVELTDWRTHTHANWCIWLAFTTYGYIERRNQIP